MEFGQFLSYYKRKNVIKKFCKSRNLKTNSRPFCVCNELSRTSIGQWNFWSKLLLLDIYWQSNQNLSKSAHWPPHIVFFDKKFYFVILNKLVKFYYQTVYFPSCSVKFVSCFMLRHLMMPWHLNIWKIKIWLSQKRKEVSKWNKNHFSLFHKCSFLDIKKQLAKMQQTQPLKEPQTISIYWFYLLRNHVDTTTKSK